MKSQLITDGLREIYRNVLTLLFLIVLTHPALSQNVDDDNKSSVSQGTVVKATYGDQTARLNIFGCPTISGLLTVGEGDLAVSIRLSETLKALDPGKDPSAREGLCHYEGTRVAALVVSTGGLTDNSKDVFRLSASLEEADISIYRKFSKKIDEPGMFPDIKLVWDYKNTDELVVFQRWGVDFRVESFGALIQTTDDNKTHLSDSSLTLRMMADGDVHLGGPLYLGGNTKTLITYNWNSGANSWAGGRWDVSGFSTVFLEMRPDGSSLPIAKMALDFDPDTYVAFGRLALTRSPLKWEVSGFKVTLSDSSILARANLIEGTVKLVRGSIRGKVHLASPLAGDLHVQIVSSKNDLQMQINSNSSFSAFGVTCYVTDLRAHFRSQFLSFNKISGRVSLSHPSFTNGRIGIESFVIKNGKLTRFSVNTPAAISVFGVLYRIVRSLT